MFINKAENGDNNICSKNVYNLRKNLGISQRELADKLQIQSLDIDKNAIQRIEAGKRFVTDIELLALSQVFNVNISDLIL